MKSLIKIIFYAAVIMITACEKPEPPVKEDLYPEVPLSTPSSTAIATFHKPDPFYQLFVYRYNEETKLWTNRIGSHFSTISTTDPSALGFTNPYVTNSGIALFDMVRLYSVQIASPTNNINTAKINADKVLQFFPDYEGAKTGIVKVVPQDVVISKNPNSTFEPGVPTFKIGISGGGTYDERTKIITLEVIFNETAIGGPAAVKRKYTMSVEAQILN